MAGRYFISVGMRNARSASSIKGRSWRVLLSREVACWDEDMEEGRPAFPIAYEDCTVQRHIDYTTIYVINLHSVVSGDCQLI